MTNRFVLRNLFFPLFTIFVTLAIVPWSEGLNQPSSLVTTTSTQLKYHKGPLFTGPRSINIYLIWYGAFSPTNRTTITSFFSSFDPSTAPVLPRRRPTVSTWWKTTQSYKDVTEKPASGTIKLADQVGGDNNYSLGKNIKRAHVAVLVKNMIVNKEIPFDPMAINLVLTASDVTVERFCMGSCGFHDTTLVYPGQRIVYAHVGDPHTQCPGLCAWPYAVPTYGPPGPPLVAPNGIGIDGMVINIATVVAGAATNPLKSGYFQGDAVAPLEAVSACTGIFGSGAYPGYPGALMVDRVTKASYNVYGMDGRKFLLPAM
ncbi:protein EXORDIUM-like 2 [Telopea speciosissima]|uniref:protein EXORDIUM-like 2 n=1 Tax=Telopea speciosissima TaxID=54955 RepID=UPI001CC655AE|nr:protein EXORDIUM-like 2 [Telopea speciosissima]